LSDANAGWAFFDNLVRTPWAVLSFPHLFCPGPAGLVLRIGPQIVPQAAAKAGKPSASYQFFDHFLSSAV
jgi:hypothetical protein